MALYLPPFFHQQLPILLPVLLLLTLASAIPATISQFEAEALFSIMDSMSSDRDWRSFSNSNPCDPSSSWPGLECRPGHDGLLHVTKLVFGTHPNPSCKTSATFPSRIFTLLPFLQSLHFLSCFKVRKTTLFFPQTNSSSSSRLQQLSLRSNPSLIGPIPSQISSLVSLQVLTLTQNNLHGEIPVSISALISLIHLDLSYNLLTGQIPAHLGRLSSLVDLDLSYNSVSGPIPASIGDLSMLQKLDLSSNSLSGTIPRSMERLKQLSFLALSENRLSGSLKGLSNLQRLQYLFMDSNPMFVPLPSELGSLPRLQELRLANSGYCGPIPASFAGLKNLTAMSLEKNQLSGQIPPGLAGLGRMYHLNLSWNMLGGPVPFTADFLGRLGRNLDLSGNSGLCFNATFDVYIGIFSGVGACRNAPSSSSSSSSNVAKPLERSSVASAYIMPAGMLYWVYEFMGFSATCLCLCLCHI